MGGGALTNTAAAEHTSVLVYLRLKGTGTRHQQETGVKCTERTGAWITAFSKVG